MCTILNFDQPKYNLEIAGLYSGSTLVNLFSLLFLLLLIFIINMIVEGVIFLIKKKTPREDIERI